MGQFDPEKGHTLRPQPGNKNDGLTLFPISYSPLNVRVHDVCPYRFGALGSSHQ